MTALSPNCAIAGATVIVREIEPLMAAYAGLGLTIAKETPDWGRLPDSVESRASRSVYLAQASARPWLRLVELDDAPEVARFTHTGWFSLEVTTCDVRRLAGLIDTLDGFERLSGPAPLDVDDGIVAMQVIGPADEMYYFSEIARPLPPFDLPVGRSLVDSLFIAVQTTCDRTASQAFWEQMAQSNGTIFDTRIGVINRGLGLDYDHRLPVAVIQLAGQTLIEIDEVPVGKPPPEHPTCGIAMISLHGDGAARVVRGPAGEWVECRNC